jgi:uncharacterized protein YceK
MKILILITALALSGCATCRTHPVACTVGAVVAAGAVAAAASSGSHGSSGHGY